MPNFKRENTKNIAYQNMIDSVELKQNMTGHVKEKTHPNTVSAKKKSKVKKRREYNQDGMLFC